MHRDRRMHHTRRHTQRQTDAQALLGAWESVAGPKRAAGAGRPSRLRAPAQVTPLSAGFPPQGRVSALGAGGWFRCAAALDQCVNRGGFPHRHGIREDRVRRQQGLRDRRVARLGREGERAPLRGHHGEEGVPLERGHQASGGHRRG